MDYTALGLKRIADDLTFTAPQIDLLGRLLTFDIAVAKLESIEYSNTTLYGQPIIEVRQPREMHIEMRIEQALKAHGHDEVLGAIKNRLTKVGLQIDGLFAYCAHSYGIERDDVTVHFGYL